VKRTLRSFTEKRLARLKELLLHFTISDDQEILHQIRVEIKKIKALLRLLHYARRKFDYHHAFLPFRDIFRACGAIRDPYVMYKLMAEITEEPHHTNIGNDQRIIDFRKQIPAYILAIEIQEQKLPQIAGRVSGHTYRKYLRKKRRELRRRLFPKFKRSQLHDIRKLMKEIWYLSAITKIKKPVLRFYRKAAGLIGDWHDKQILIQRIASSGIQRPELIAMLRRIGEDDLKQLKPVVRKFYRARRA